IAQLRKRNTNSSLLILCFKVSKAILPLEMTTEAESPEYCTAIGHYFADSKINITGIRDQYPAHINSGKHLFRILMFKLLERGWSIEYGFLFTKIGNRR
ncbi:hypothetical protein TNIN_269551, partial [Trichonephila inaurata madagascariensis]